MDSHRHDELIKLSAPLRKAEISLIDRTEPGDEVPLVELRIREGKRITTLELDTATASSLAAALLQWADGNRRGDA